MVKIRFRIKSVSLSYVLIWLQTENRLSSYHRLVYFKSLVEAIKTDNLVLNDLGSSNVKMPKTQSLLSLYTHVAKGFQTPGAGIRGYHGFMFDQFSISNDLGAKLSACTVRRHYPRKSSKRLF